MKKRVCIAMIDEPGVYARIAERLGDCELCWMKDLPAPERLKALKGADCLMINMMIREISEEEKAALDKVGMTQMISAGVDHVDFEKIPAGAVICSNVGGWAQPMAEHALAMALCCTRKLIPQKFDLARGEFKRGAYHLRSLQGLRALILGYGGIGRACATVFRAMGCEIAALGRTAPEEKGLAAAYGMDQLHDALPDADLVILALPSTVETRGVIGSRELAEMKDNAILINLARGALIQKEALMEHLQSHPEFFAALDAWWQEGKDFPAGDPLVALPNVTVSAHNSNQSQTAAMLALDSAIDNVLRYLKGEEPRGRVRRELYGKD